MIATTPKSQTNLNKGHNQSKSTISKSVAKTESSSSCNKVEKELPEHIDSDDPSPFIPNTFNYNEIMQMNNNNIKNYKESKTKIVYSEESLNYLNGVKGTSFIVPDDDMLSPCITYDELLLLLKENQPYKIVKNNQFVYKNYDSSNKLIFNSKFESGNLRMAIKQSENEYDLIIRPDTNTYKGFYWFYFSIKINEKFIKTINEKNGIIKFNIINMYKNTELFSEMVRILSYYNGKWSRNTHNIYFYLNGLNIGNVNTINIGTSNHSIVNSENSLYTLSFSFDLNLLKNKEGEITRNIVYFSYCYPYSYTYLTTYLSRLVNKYSNGDMLRFETIGHTLNNKSIYMLVITDFNDSFDDLAKKSSIFLTSRVHPGESNSSYVIEGLIDFLLSDDQIAFNLRKHFIFKIVPMLNPDGVIIGNYRTNLLGKDLNRMWIETELSNSPSIFYTKTSINKTLKSRDIFLFCDFHGHSHKSNFFIYSCKTKTNSNVIKSKGNLNNINNLNNSSQTEYSELVFPYLFSKENSVLDRYSCINKISPGKIKTARAVMKNEFGIDFSYCIESSVSTIKINNNVYVPFTIELYKKIGADFCRALIKMTNSKIFYSSLNFVRNEKKDKKNKGKDIVGGTSAANLGKNNIHFLNNYNYNYNNSNGVKNGLPIINPVTQHSPRLSTNFGKKNYSVTKNYNKIYSSNKVLNSYTYSNNLISNYHNNKNDGYNDEIHYINMSKNMQYIDKYYNY